MSATTVDPDGFGRLASAFTATRENPNTRAAYTRDLAALAAGLGVPDPPADAPPFGVEDDPVARAAAVALSRLPLAWWQEWRDALPGRVATRRRRVAATRAFCGWWSRTGFSSA